MTIWPFVFPIRLIRSRSLPFVMIAAAILVMAGALPGWASSLGAHTASGSGFLPDGARLELNAVHVSGGGGTGVAIYTPVGGAPIRIVLTCVAIGNPAPGFPPGSHFFIASGIGLDLMQYHITIWDVPIANGGDWAAIATGTAPECSGPQPLALGADSFLILI